MGATDYELKAKATNGDRCLGELHRFRIGVDATAPTEFSARLETFRDAITNALIEHVEKRRPGKLSSGLYLQVGTGPGGARWVNVENPETGGVMAITHMVAGQTGTCETLFRWACNAVQMSRDIEVIAGGLATNSP